MKKPLFIANWKMNLTGTEAEKLLRDIKRTCVFSPQVTAVVCPSPEQVKSVGEFVHPLALKLGAQNVCWEDSGSFTGESSPKSLHQLGVEYVIVGHSERRKYLHETDELINKKVAAVLRNHMIPVLCVGESYDERSDHLTEHVIRSQVEQALQGVALDKHHQICIAYEPLWAIGSGQAVEPGEAEHIGKVIRQVVIDIYHEHERVVDDFLHILYGGSVTPKNADTYIGQLVRGVLVGGASLKKSDFCAMVQALNTLAT